MGIINTGSFPAHLWPGANRTFWAEYNRHEPYSEKIFKKINSTMAFERHLSNTNPGVYDEKGEMDSVKYGSLSQGFTKDAYHVDYAKGLKLSRNAVEDNVYRNQLTAMSTALALGAFITKETVGSNIFKRGFNSSYTGADGKELLATDHPFPVGGSTWQNELTVPSDPNEAALEDIFIIIAKWTDENGNPIDVKPRRIISPPDQYFVFTRLLQTTQQPGNANNDVNAIKYNGMLPEGLMVWPYLNTDTDAWFVQTDCPEGLIYAERSKQSFAEDQEFDTFCYKFLGRFRGSYYWVDAHCLAGSAGA